MSRTYGKTCCAMWWCGLRCPFAWRESLHARLDRCVDQVSLRHVFNVRVHNDE